MNDVNHYAAPVCRLTLHYVSKCRTPAEALPILSRNGGVRAVGGASKSCEEVLYILGTVFLCILKIIVNGIVHIQTKFRSFLRLGGIA